MILHCLFVIVDDHHHQVTHRLHCHVLVSLGSDNVGAISGFTVKWEGLLLFLAES